MKIRNLTGVAVTAAALCVATAVPAVAQQAEPDSTGPAPTSETVPSSQQTADSGTESSPSATAEDPVDAAEPGEGAIDERYASLPPDLQAQIGEPVADEVVEGDALRYRDYENARFYWTPAHGVKIVFGGILAKFMALGAHEAVGVPTSDELGTEDGAARYTEFVTQDEAATVSAIYWTPSTGAHLMRGRILEHWHGLDAAGRAIGYPTTDSTVIDDGFGVYNHFVDADGVRASIYWTQPTGANMVKGAIRDKWAASGWEAGPLGYPTSDELVTKNGVGRYTLFNGDGEHGAQIVWSAETGAHSVVGLIADRYEELFGANGTLGLPTTDERATPDGRGRFNHFTGTGGASIYWTPQTGAHEVYGAIRGRWASLGWERSYLGYPIRGEFDVPWGRSSEFEHGYIDWHRDTGQVYDFPRG